MDATHKITKNLGGDRLGSGNKNNISMHAYNRSTHDLSRAWRSSMNAGTLVPFFVEPALPGDTWTIDLESMVRTVPAIGPLYGSYKLQMDIFECPIRLYNGLLHNNMTKIGLNMAQVKLPKIELKHRIVNPYNHTTDRQQIAKDSLLNYLGINGIKDASFYAVAPNTPPNTVDVKRKFNAVPILAYYDIYKNYYANKQEEKGMYIVPDIEENYGTLTKIVETNMSGETYDIEEPTAAPDVAISEDTFQASEFQPREMTNCVIPVPKNWTVEMLYMAYVDANSDYGQVSLNLVYPQARINNPETAGAQYNYWCIITGYPDIAYLNPTDYAFIGFAYNRVATYSSEIKLEEFDLTNIDDARIKILQNTGLNNELLINSLGYPYKKLVESTNDGVNYNRYAQCGLAIKTYQSDLFQNWLQTEWIDGVNGINQITAIDVSSGSFTIDALNLANKVYNMLNRIAVSGGSYEDYIEAVYSTTALRRAETPVYKGGLSAEIVFEEVVSTAATKDDPLGTLAGKGNQAGKRGGHIEIRCEEPAFIIGIVSITPRVDYSQGNKWFMTELDTLDDLHKPALDGIGFEDLLQERFAWWGTYLNYDGNDVKLAAGKVPAWINYMTAVNETHGDFAEENKCMFMTLNRRYEMPEDIKSNGVKDLTTYINPTKYNYSFADTTLDAQNFWVQIGIRAEARRVMSAKIIPNL